MIHSVKFTCFLDTNVIYPILTRDILLWFAHYELYTPKWSPDIFIEWAEVMRRKNVSEAEILKRIENVNLAFAGAMVQDYESITKTLKLPDLDEYQVLDICRKNGLKDTADYLHALL